MGKKIFLCLLVLSAFQCHAGLFFTTVHSRANCINNESITWWAGHPYNWRVISVHRLLSVNHMHGVDTGFQYKDRVAAIHWGEGHSGGWEVTGHHFLKGHNDRFPFDTTKTTGCDIIEGWI